MPVNPSMKTYHLGKVLENPEPRLVIVANESVDRMREITSVPVDGIGSVWCEIR